MRTSTVLVVPGVSHTGIVGSVVSEVAVWSDGDGITCGGVGNGGGDIVVTVSGTKGNGIVCGGVGEFSGTGVVRVDIGAEDKGDTA